ncbi:MAG: transposase [Kurthia sp.]|nr:transposase [Candidatus Kurthia equi]
MWQAIRTLKNWQVEILNSFIFGYSNGFLEGINTVEDKAKHDVHVTCLILLASCKHKGLKLQCIWL